MFSYKDDDSLSGDIQRILDQVGDVEGIRGALLVSEEGFPLFTAKKSCLPLNNGVEILIAAMVAGTVSILSHTCNQLHLGKDPEFIYIQTPLGLGMISRIDPQESDLILLLISSTNLKFGLFNYLLTSTKIKILKRLHDPNKFIT